MNSILLLTKLQLQQTIGGARSTIEKKTGANGAMAGTAIIGLIVFVGIAWFGYSAYGIVGEMGIDKTVYDILFMACGGLTFVFTLPSVLGSFFGSSDINDLLPLPVSPFAIVFSKALGALTTGYLWTLVFIAAPLAGWGIAAGADYQYWVVYVLAVIFTPMMPVSYAGTISIIVAALFKRVRRKDTITTLTTVLTLLISIGAFFIAKNTNAGSDMVQMLGSMSDSVGSVVMAFPAYGFAVYALSHTDPLGSWLFVLLSLASFAVFIIVARILYMRIVTSLSSGAGKAEAYAGTQSQAQTPVFKALLVTEVRKLVRNSSILLYYVVYPLVICPVMFCILFMTDSISTLFAKLSEVDNATDVFAGFALCALMALVALSASSNRVSITGVSREGSNWVYMKYIPVPLIDQLRAKILPGFVVNALITLVFMAGGGYLLITKMGLDPLAIISGVVLMMSGAWLMTVVGAWSGCRNPNVHWGNDGDVNPKTLKGGGGEIRTLLVGFVYAALPLLVSPLVNLDPHVFMPVLAIVGVVAAVVLSRLLLNAAVRSIEALE